MDVDNLAKCVSDGLRHVCFTDDNQVTYLEVSKGIVFDWTGVRVTVEPTDCGRELFSK
jgi:Holliday junction resolvase RusA-like endonuclease